MTAAVDLPSLLPPVPESLDGRDAWWEGVLYRAIPAVTPPSRCPYSMSTFSG